MGQGHVWLSIGFSSLLAACGSSGGGGEGVYDVEGWATLRSQNGGMISYHSGFDEAPPPDGNGNRYTVPLGFVGAGSGNFTTGDPAIATVQGSLVVNSSQVPDGVVLTGVLIQTKGVGTTTVSGDLNGQTYTAMLTVNRYTTADVELGTKRYTAPDNANMND